jgi:hypothetical protein
MRFLIRKSCKAHAAMTVSKRQRNRSIGAPQGLENLTQDLPWVWGPLSVRPVGGPESNRTELKNPGSGASEFFVRSPFSVALSGRLALEKLTQAKARAKLSWPFGPGIHGAFNIDPIQETG